MKKVLFAFVFVALLCLTAVSAYADGEPRITLQPSANPHFDPDGYVTFTVEFEGVDMDSPGFRGEWHIIYQGVDYEVFKAVNMPWTQFVDTIVPEQIEKLGKNVYTSTMTFKTVTQELDGAEVYYYFEDGHYSVKSSNGYVTVGADSEPPKIYVPAEVTVYKEKDGSLSVDYAASTMFTQNSARDEIVPHILNGKLVLTALTKVPHENEQSVFVWYITHTGKLEHISALQQSDFNSNSVELDVDEPGTKYYVVMSQTSKGGMCYSSVIPVTVIERSALVEDMKITKDVIAGGIEGKEYNEKLTANDPDALFNIYYNPGHANDFDKTGLTLLPDGTLKGVIKAAPGEYTFTVCASGNSGEDYMEYTLFVNKDDSPSQGSETDLTETQSETEPSDSEKATEKADDPTEKTPEESVPEPDGKNSDKNKDGGKESGDKFPVIPVILIGLGAAGLGVAITLLAVKGKKKA